MQIPQAAYNRLTSDACSTTNLKPASTPCSGWEMDDSNIALVEPNIGLIGNYHLYPTHGLPI
jgi:hypothetical protein